LYAQYNLLENTEKIKQTLKVKRTYIK